MRDGARELFAEWVALFEPLLPVPGTEDPRALLASGALPRLEELRLHQGTVWRWNRAIHDPADGGHLRIELRALPSGPTPRDMAASAALLVGLTLGLRDSVGALLPGFPFEHAGWNFYRAAQRGLGARSGAQTLPVAGFLEASEGRLVCGRRFRPLMIAIDGPIAREDCLFYLVLDGAA